MVFRLDDRLIFPDPELAENDGLLAVGGDLSAERLMLAYQNGIFPWYSDDTPILWYSPHERFVLFPQEVKISKSMWQVLNSNKFIITVNQNFEAVIKACSAAPRDGQDGTWITDDMIAAYVNLHKLGYAHSYEVWHNSILVGGLYGISLSDVFCGESMFSNISNASKVALITLVQSKKYTVIDCQVYTKHLKSLGAKMIPRAEYMAYIKGL